MAETLTIRTASSTEVVKIAVPGPQGPKGDKGDPGDVAGLPLSTLGDTLYRGASENQRLPIGTAGQILKVSAGGIPEWGAAPATGVTSVTGTAPIVSSGGNTPAISISEATTSAAGSMSSADKIKLDGIAAGAEVNVNADWNAASGDAQILNKPASFTPSSHGSSHHTGGTDAIAPNQISAAWAQVLSNQTITGNTLLSAGRNRRITLFAVGATANVDLPHENNQAGDVVTLVSDWSVASTLTIRRASVMSGTTPVAHSTLATLNASGQSFTFVSNGTATGWSLRSVDTHTHGNLTNDGKLGSTAGLPVVTTTAGAITTLALGTANQVLRVNSGATGVEFADLAASGVTGAASSASDVLGVSGANITGVDANADRLVFWDDSASKLTYLAPSTGIEIDGTNLKAKITSDPTGVTGADAITNIMSLTQAEYDAIGSPNASTLYIITDP